MAALLALAMAFPARAHDAHRGDGGGGTPAAPADSTDSLRDARPGEKVLELEERSVTSRRYRRATATQAETTLRGRDLDRTRGLSLGDALEVVPGVTNLRTGASVSKPSIRGMQGSRIVILNNGVRQEGQQWGSEHAPEVDPFLASRITVVKGASSVRYGPDALGGVVLVEPWPLRQAPGLGGEVDAVGFTNGAAGAASATVEGSPAAASVLKGLGWRLQGTAKKGGNTSAPRYVLDNTGSEEYGFSGGLGWEGRDKGVDLYYSRFDTRLGIFTGSHIGSVGDLKAAIARDVPETPSDFSYAIDRPNQEVVHHLFKARSQAAFPGLGRWELIYSAQHNSRAEFDHKPLNDALAARNRPELLYEITTHGAELSWEGDATPSLHVDAGATGAARFNVYEGRAFIPNFLDYGGGLYAIGHWERDVVGAEAGLRYDYKFLRTYAREKGEVVRSGFEFQNLSGMAGLHARFRPGWTGRVHLSSAFRPPGVNELFSNGLHHGAAAVEFGDRGLRPERAYDLTASLEWKRPRWRAEAEAFHTYVEDYIGLYPQLPPTLTIRGAFPTFRYRQTDARLTGGELSLRAPILGPLSYAGKVSLLRAFEDHTGDYLPLMPADRFENGLEAEWKALGPLRDLSLGATLRTVLEQTHAPADSLDYAPPPEGYTLVGLRAGFRWPIRDFSWEWDLEVTSLLNTSYRDYTNRFRYYADDPGRNVVLRWKLPFDLPGGAPSAPERK